MVLIASSIQTNYRCDRRRRHSCQKRCTMSFSVEILKISLNRQNSRQHPVERPRLACIRPCETRTAHSKPNKSLLTKNRTEGRDPKTPITYMLVLKCIGFMSLTGKYLIYAYMLVSSLHIGIGLSTNAAKPAKALAVRPIAGRPDAAGSRSYWAAQKSSQRALKQEESFAFLLGFVVLLACIVSRGRRVCVCVCACVRKRITQSLDLVANTTLNPIIPRVYRNSTGFL